MNKNQKNNAASLQPKREHLNRLTSLINRIQRNQQRALKMAEKNVATCRSIENDIDLVATEIAQVRK